MFFGIIYKLQLIKVFTQVVYTVVTTEGGMWRVRSTCSLVLQLSSTSCVQLLNIYLYRFHGRPPLIMILIC